MSLHLFEGYGVELEYMLVERETLAVLPAADRVLEAAAGEITSEVTVGPLSWSNELVLHVVELKTDGPAAHLAGLADAFQDGVRRIGEILAPRGGLLMPTAMHPWFDPERETRLWPHEHSPVYQAFDRIFGCRGHGWSNLQSAHLNLPFAGDEEFGRLHAAIRLVLPLLPALAAASPILEGRLTGLLDNRLEVYRTNSRRFASVTGQVIPEPVFTRADYEREILEPIYRDLAPLDPEGVLRDEFANARGAIARFGRGSIEIRLLDVQEAPRADLAVIAAVVGALKLLVAERWSPLAAQQAQPTEPLAALLRQTIRTAEETVIEDGRLPGAVRFPRHPRHRRDGSGATWPRTAAAAGALEDGALAADLEVILTEGPLARRMLRALGDGPGHADQERLYRRLCDCLAAGEMFRRTEPEPGPAREPPGAARQAEARLEAQGPTRSSAPYSELKAVIGSTRVARRAGSTVASSTTAPRSPRTAAKTAGSRAETP